MCPAHRPSSVVLWWLLVRLFELLTLSHGAHLCVLCSARCLPSMSWSTSDAGPGAAKGGTKSKGNGKAGAKAPVVGLLALAPTLPLAKPKFAIKKAQPKGRKEKEKSEGKAKAAACSF